MKLKNLFIASLAVLAIYACDKKDNHVDIDGKKDALITISVSPNDAPPPVTKLVGNLSGNGILAPGLPAESVIKKCWIYVFSGDALESFEVAAKNATSGNWEGKMEITVGSKTIAVVVNGDDAWKNITSYNALQAKTQELALNTNAALPNGMLMTATKTEVIAKTTTDIAMKVDRVNARVALAAAKLGTIKTEFTNLFDKIEIHGVMAYNVPKASKIFGDNLAIDKKEDLLFGAQWGEKNNIPHPYLGTIKADLAETIAPAADTIDKEKIPYFYITENTATNNTAILLKAKMFKGTEHVKAPGLYTDKDGFTYYPVEVNKKGITPDPTNPNLSTGVIKRNTQYNIGLTITGPGQPGPEAPEKVNVTVTCTANPWIVVSQNVTW